MPIPLLLPAQREVWRKQPPFIVPPDYGSQPNLHALMVTTQLGAPQYWNRGRRLGLAGVGTPNLLTGSNREGVNWWGNSGTSGAYQGAFSALSTTQAYSLTVMWWGVTSASTTRIAMAGILNSWRHLSLSQKPSANGNTVYFGANIGTNAEPTAGDSFSAKIGSWNIATVRQMQGRQVLTLNGMQDPIENTLSGAMYSAGSTCLGPEQVSSGGLVWCMVGLHLGFLSDAEVAALHGNPWSVMQPLIRRRPLPLRQRARPVLYSAPQFVPTPEVLNRQPAQIPLIEAGDTLTKGLVGAFLPHSFVNVADGVVLSGAPPLKDNSLGKVVGAGVLEYPLPLDSSDAPANKFDFSSSMTALVFGSQETYADLAPCLWRGVGPTGYAWRVGFGSAAFPPNTHSGVLCSFGSYHYQTPTTGFWNGKLPHSIAMTVDAAGNCASYADGKVVDTGSSSAPAYEYNSTSTDGLRFGGLRVDGSDGGARPALALIWSRALSAEEIAKISQNPWQVFAAPPRRVLGTPTLKEVANYRWSPVGSSEAVSSLNEVSPVDTTYAKATKLAKLEIALGATITEPNIDSHHILRYRLSASSVKVLVYLMQGATVIAWWSHVPSRRRVTTFKRELTPVQVATITDYSKLRLRVEALP